MESDKLALLHEHYRDSCSLMQKQRTARDRYFYLVLLVISLVWFDVVAPLDFTAIAGEAIKKRFELTVVPNLGYLRSVLWFVLLGLIVRYFQTSLSVERGYDYIHDLEEVLATEVHKGFGREGAAYLSKYPLFLQWAHFLYVVATPIVLLIVVVWWTRAQIHSSPWSGLTWFDCFVSAAMVVSVVLYWAFRIAKPEGAPKPIAPNRRRRPSRSI